MEGILLLIAILIVAIIVVGAVGAAVSPDPVQDVEDLLNGDGLIRPVSP